jgi:hypothetical protein
MPHPHLGLRGAHSCRLFSNLLGQRPGWDLRISIYGADLGSYCVVGKTLGTAFSEGEMWKAAESRAGVLPSRKPNPARGCPGEPATMAVECTFTNRGRLERPGMRPNSEGSAGARTGELRLSQSGSER